MIHTYIDMQVAGETLQPPRPLPWYSNKLAWHMSFSRGQLRKLPILAEIHELLKRENEAGSITRQEAVSMVPPLFLAVEPHHKVCTLFDGLCCARCTIKFRALPVQKFTTCRFWTCAQHLAPRQHRFWRCFMLGL